VLAATYSSLHHDTLLNIVTFPTHIIRDADREITEFLNELELQK
jgi:hypothetical protein